MGCCPIHNERTPSFEIELKNGCEVFHCFGCGAGGDVLTFIQNVEHLEMGPSIERLKQLAGVTGPNKEYIEQADKVQNTYQGFTSNVAVKKAMMPEKSWKAAEEALQRSPRALNWLLETRGITAATAKNIRFGFDGENHILFPRIIGDKIHTIKYRSMKTKSFFYAKDMEAKSLFNLETISPFEPVFVTEGEFDAAILEQCGYCAVSLPSAGVKLMPDMKKALKQADCIFLAGDNDGGVGNTYMKQLARELGENTFIITWPEAKDANEFYLNKCNKNIETFRDRMNELQAVARRTPVEGFSSILERIRTNQGTDLRNDPNRLHFPWAAVDDMNYSPTGSIVTFYSTYSGTGKTVLTTQIAMHEAKRGKTVVVYSPELRDDNYLALLASQWVGSEREGGLDRAGRITAEDYQRTFELLEKTYSPAEGGPKETRQIQFYVGYSLPETDTDKIIDFIEHTVKVTGADRFVIDTLHRIISAGGKESLVELEGKIVKRLESIANKYGTIFLLIGQSNKEAEGIKEKNRNEYGVLRGSRELIDVSYGVYLLHRPRMPKDGPTSVNLLSPEAELVLIKDRGKGPGASSVPMLYRRDSSTFEVRDVIHKLQPAESRQSEECPF